MCGRGQMSRVTTQQMVQCTKYFSLVNEAVTATTAVVMAEAGGVGCLHSVIDKASSHQPLSDQGRRA